LIALEALVPCASVIGVVVPNDRSAAPLVDLARRHGLGINKFDPQKQHELAKRLDTRPDLICVATFPSILSRELLEVAMHGAINVHWSLLPRHRGPDPLFWTYLNDDRQTGVTLHWLDKRVDGGPILLQRQIPLARGRPVVDLYNELAAIGAELFVNAIHLIEAGEAPRIPQDERAATREPSRTAGSWSIDLANWPTERVWHVLRGLTVGSAALLRDERGAPVFHGPARAYVRETHGRPAGRIENRADGLRVFCSDGYVDVDRASPAKRSWLRTLLTRLPPQS